MKVAFRLLLIFTLFCIAPIFSEYTYEIDKYNEVTKVHVLTFDRAEYQVKAVRAQGWPISREHVSILAENAVAGINGGFWKFNGTPAGILKIDGTLLGRQKKPRGAIGWNEKEVRVDRVVIEDDGTIRSLLTPGTWNHLDTIIGGIPVLIHQGKRMVDVSDEKTVSRFVFNKYARTAIGVLENGMWVFVVVEVIEKHPNSGMTLRELALYMEALGCTDALNLDGGSSSILVLENVVKNPGRHPPVSDAILLVEHE